MKITLTIGKENPVVDNYDSRCGWRFVFGNKVLLIKKDGDSGNNLMVMVGLVSHDVEEFTIDARTGDVISSKFIGTYEDIKYDLRQTS